MQAGLTTRCLTAETLAIDCRTDRSGRLAQECAGTRRGAEDAEGAA